LDELVQTWEAKGLAQEIVLTGYTDASGTQAYNNQLSKERARAVRNYLRQQGVTQRIEAIAKGETQLRYREDHRNRRVTISLQASPSQALSEALLPLPEAFVVPVDRDTVLFGSQGTVVKVPAGAFATNSEAPVELELVECYALGDMLMAQLTTLGTDGRLLTSKGMVHLRAVQEGEELALQKDLELTFPTRTAGDGTDLYYAVGEGGNMRWKLADTATDVPVTALSEPTFSEVSEGTSILMGDSVAMTLDGTILSYWKTQGDGSVTMVNAFGPNPNLKSAFQNLQDSLGEALELSRSRDGRVWAVTPSNVEERAQRAVVVEFEEEMGFRITELGWLNCDYFYRNGQEGERVPMRIVTNAPAEANFILVPRGSKQLLPYSYREQNAFEWKIPEGNAVTLIGFAKAEEPGEFWFVKRRVRSQRGELSLEMVKGTAAQIRKALDSI